MENLVFFDPIELKNVETKQEVKLSPLATAKHEMAKYIKDEEKVFFVDKYSTLTESRKFNKDIYHLVDNISNHDNFPHMLIYGPRGCGKKTLTKYIISKLYGTYSTKKKFYVVEKSTEPLLIVNEGQFFIEIDMTINERYDKYIIQTFIKNYALHIPITGRNKKKNIRTIIIYDSENISYFSQTALRGIIEFYSDTIRFIMVTKTITKIIGPIKSRLTPIRMKSPEDHELFFLCKRILLFEKLELVDEEIINLIKKKDNNIKNILMELQLKKYSSKPFSFDVLISDIAKKLLDYPSSIKLLKERKIESQKIIDDLNIEKKIIEEKITEAEKILNSETESDREKDTASYNIDYHNKNLDTIKNKIMGHMSIINENDLEILLLIERYFYTVITTNIDESEMLSSLTDELLSKDSISEETKKEIIELTLQTETMLRQSNRKIIPLNNYTINILMILRKDFLQRNENSKQ